MSLESGARRLQFDTAKPATTTPDVAASDTVKCAACGCTIAIEYYDVNDQTVCNRCRHQLASLAETPQGFGTFGKAALYGFGAAIAGATLYYAVIALANLEIGIVAIAIGYMVGFAVRTAANNRGGLRFQLLAVVLTYWAVGLAYTPLVFSASKEAEKQEAAVTAPASTAASEPATATTAAPASPLPGEPVAMEEEPANAVGFVFALGALLALTFTLPVLVVVGSLPGGLISAAIIAFGMHQAWRMTGAPNLVITGPYRIVRAAVAS